jgi:hypothetical protein
MDCCSPGEDLPAPHDDIDIVTYFRFNIEKLVNTKGLSPLARCNHKEAKYAVRGRGCGPDRRTL